MTTHAIEIHEYTDQQPNGDRDPRTHPSARFEVELLTLIEKHPQPQPVRLATFQQFESNWCAIQGTRDQYLSKATQYAKPIAEALGIPLTLIQIVAEQGPIKYHRGAVTPL